MPAPFKNKVDGGKVVPSGAGKVLQEVQTVALVQTLQTGLLSVHGPQLPSFLRYTPGLQTVHLVDDVQVVQSAPQSIQVLSVNRNLPLGQAVHTAGAALVQVLQFYPVHNVQVSVAGAGATPAVVVL